MSIQEELYGYYFTAASKASESSAGEEISNREAKPLPPDDAQRLALAGLAWVAKRNPQVVPHEHYKTWFSGDERMSTPDKVKGSI